MAKGKRKWLSEFAVNISSARWQVIPPSDLARAEEMPPEMAEVSRNCHIYAICRRPASSFDPATFYFDGKVIHGRLIFRVAGQSNYVPFKLPFVLEDGAISVRVSAYPHRDIETISQDGQIVRYVPARLLSISGPVAHEALINLEVLYVGQAYAAGRRSAFDRLKSHATLQKILVDMQNDMPDDEILILAFEYADYQVLVSIDGRAKEAEAGDADLQRFRSIMDNPLTKHRQICLIEAGLIRFFQPRYNEIYKSSFPLEDQKILNQCYRLDFSALIVEIDTEDLNLGLYAPKVARSHHHIAKFDLVRPDDRRSFFTFIDRDGEAVDWPDIIRPSG